MVDIAEIEDRESFRAWLEATGQPRQVCVALAARAAARVLPVVWNVADERGRFSALPVLRATLVAQVAGLAPPGVMTEPGHASALRAAADAAARAAYAAYAANAAYAAANAAYAAYAANAAADAADANADAWAAIRCDCAEIAAGDSLTAAPLFPEEPPAAISSRWFAVAQRLGESDWDFWLDWYSRLLASKAQNWLLLLEIAIQEDDFWQGSDDEVNARIAGIVARFAKPDAAAGDPIA